MCLFFPFFFLFSAIKLRPKEGETYFDVVAIVDPATRDAQRLAPLLMVWMHYWFVVISVEGQFDGHNFSSLF